MLTIASGMPALRSGGKQPLGTKRKEQLGCSKWGVVLILVGEEEEEEFENDDYDDDNNNNNNNNKIMHGQCIRNIDRQSYVYWTVHHLDS